MTLHLYDVEIDGRLQKVKVEAGPSKNIVEIQTLKMINIELFALQVAIHPVAQKIADLTGAEAFDGFKSSPESMLCCY